MSRRRRAIRRKIQGDPVYNSVLASKFINCMMVAGKKSLSARLFYQAVDKLSESAAENDGFGVFEAAIKNIKPLSEVKSRRVGGSNYQVPVRVRWERQTTLALRWVIAEARKRKEKTFALRLAGELQDAANGMGSAMRKRETIHKMAESNRAFSHFKF
jgi:small subunit ribosomal protein S7